LRFDFRLVTLPALDQTDIEVEQIKASPDSLVDDIVNRLWLMIKGRNRRQNDCTIFGRMEHAAQVSGMQRDLAHDQHEMASLLQSHVGRPAQRVSIVP
jgi:hypothetical protein